MAYSEENKEHIQHTYNSFCRIVMRLLIWRYGCGNSGERKFPLTI